MQGIHAANRLLHVLMVIWQRQDTLVLFKKKTQKNTIIPATTTLRIYNRGPTFMCAEETRKNIHLGLMYITMLSCWFYGKHFSR